MQPALGDPVQYLKGIGPARALLLEKLGITTIRALLYHLPRGWLDRGDLRPIRSVRAGETVLVRGTIGRVTARGRVLTARLADATGELDLVWFHAPAFLRKRIVEGAEFLATGKAERRRTLQIAHPQLESPTEEGQAEILPCYPLTEGLSDRVLRAALPNAAARYGPLLPEFLPEPLRRRRALLFRAAALQAIHAPATAREAEEARRRLAFDELFLLQLTAAIRRQGVRQSHAVPVPVDDRLHERILKRLPFKPTPAQERAFADLRSDMGRDRPMNRLLQGDVGSGKTAVAVYAMLATVAGGGQAALLAPTEILAAQHARTLDRWLAGSRVRSALLVGGLKKKERTAVLRKLEAGTVDLVVGTHALLEGDVSLPRLRLAVIDEQHKFGALQRTALAAKGEPPHVLVMTATPIPRTLLLTAFGDMDVTVLDGSPPGRQPVETRIVGEEDRLAAFSLVREEILRGRQAYFVAPLIDDSDKVAAKSALSLFNEVKAFFRATEVRFLHGRLPAAGKEQVMEDFRRNRASILVSTQVIEVGVDVPNATVMGIESAERYGLAQLHQLRGRIGRGGHASTCLLFSRSEEGSERLRILASTQDGFRIAEEDLRMRGPGEFFGIKQHGMPELKAADLGRDLLLLQEARAEAFGIIEADPGLVRPENARLRAAVREHFGRTDWAQG